MSRAEYDAWIETAGRDHEAAELLRDAGHYALAVFHFQQAAEKSLKAACALAGRPAFTHSLVMLLKALRDGGLAVDDELLHFARKLDVHYTQSRYPGTLGVAPGELYDREVCGEVEQWSQRIQAFAETLAPTGRA